MPVFPDDNADVFDACLLILYCSFSLLILQLLIIISFYIIFKRSCLKRKGLSETRVVPVTKKEYVLQYVSLKPISDKRLIAICRISRLIGIFITKWSVEFSLIFFGTAK